jgi:hypothetical protein
VFLLLFAIGAAVALLPLLLTDAELLRYWRGFLTYDHVDTDDVPGSVGITVWALTVFAPIAPVCLLCYLVMVLLARREGRELWIATGAIVLIVIRFLRRDEGWVWTPSDYYVVDLFAARAWKLTFTAGAFLLNCWLVAGSALRLRRMPARAHPGPITR